MSKSAKAFVDGLNLGQCDFRRIAVFEDGRVCQQGVNVFSEPYEVGS